MTLIELVFAMSILGLAALGILSSTLQSRRLAEGSIHQNTATTIAQGYLEQIKNMEFSSLDRDELPTLINQGALDTLLISPPVANMEAGAASDLVNVKSIDVNHTPDEPGDDMRMEIVVYVSNISDPANGLGDSRRVTLRYAYIFNTAGMNLRSENTLWAVRSRVPTF